MPLIIPSCPSPSSNSTLSLLIILFLARHLLTTTLSLNSQGEALLSWKQTLNASLVSLSNWDSTHPTPCNWSGISCNYAGEVIELNLRDMDLLGNLPSNLSSLSSSLNKLVLSGTNLTGLIPPEIASLRQLTYLDLSDNALNGEIPSDMCGLLKLEELHLNSNRLEGSIPMEIGNLTSLRRLILYDNHLGGFMPTTIGRLQHLQVIRAGGNKNLQGSVPEEIGNCTDLLMIGLAETSISGFLPVSLGQLRKLETIAIYTALLSGQIPPELGDCTSLQSIYLYENGLTGSIPNRLGNLRNLHTLLLWQNNIIGAIPVELGNCEQLQIIDASMNSITGSIPESFGNLTKLEELQLSVNKISGQIPSQLGNCRSLTHIELDNNQITGSIPSEFGNLPNLTLLFLWQNKLEGSIPPSLSLCQNLDAVDLSQNSLTGSIPKGIFELRNLNKLLLLSNNLSGEIPSEIGKCSSLIRFRANNNKLIGSIPLEIGSLWNLNFLDLGSNRLTGVIPEEISGCRNLTFLDLHSNSITGNLPARLNRLSALQFVDMSDNMIEGTLNPSIGSLISLTKLLLGKNKLSGSIPPEIGSCLKLQLLDLGSNKLSGEIPGSIGKIPAMEIALNLSLNTLSGSIPSEFTALKKLGILDVSHNHLLGDLDNLAELENLVVLNVSNNNFSGKVPETAFFVKLPLCVLSGNPSLCFSGERCSGEEGGGARRGVGLRVAMVVLFCAACALLFAALYVMVGDKTSGRGAHDYDNHDGEDDVDLGPPWDVTLYQKLDLSIADVAKCLTASNVIGRGRSGVVYRVDLPSGVTIAAKRFHQSEKLSAAAFSSEIATLARIRHRNIVRLLGWAANRKTKLLFYHYLCNGALGAMLHEGGIGGGLPEWESRFKVALGVAEGLAYLHHDCAPAILHRDVKSHNILLGDDYEPYLADFGLARIVEDEHSSNSRVSSFTANPHFAGSYGYFAPEYACMRRITEKSDIYSYGVVLLEMITGKRPVDPSFPENQHVVEWVRKHLKSKMDPVDIIDPKLQGHRDTQIQEMLQALGIALLCSSNRAQDRPSMKDVVALLKEICHDQAPGAEPKKPEPLLGPPKTNSFSKPGGAQSSASVTTPPQSLLLQGSSNCSLVYSSSSPGHLSIN